MKTVIIAWRQWPFCCCCCRRRTARRMTAQLCRSYLTTASDALHLDVADAQARHAAPDAAEDEAGELKAAEGSHRHGQHDRRTTVAPVLGLRVHLTHHTADSGFARNWCVGATKLHPNKNKRSQIIWEEPRRRPSCRESHWLQRDAPHLPPKTAPSSLTISIHV